MSVEIQGKGTVMNRIDVLFETWAKLNDEADMAIFAYDAGQREEGSIRLDHIWQTFRRVFANEKERESLENAFQDTMSMVLNRLYLDMEETEDEENLWDFCKQVCRFFKPGEIWREDYVIYVGRFLQKRREYAACDQWFERCTEEEPEMLIYWAYWAACLTERGEKEAAIAMLDRIMEQRPICSYGTLSLYRQTRRVYAALGEKEKSQLCRQRIGELDEDLLLYEE